MAGYKVLIPTSGIGARLGNLTKHTNKSLVRVGKKPALSYIIESYPDDTEFVITIGHYANHVQQFVKIAYPNKKITCVVVDNYSGEGSSLAYSLLKAKNYLACPFIFHVSDAIIDPYDVNIDDNWLGVCYKVAYSQYRTVSLDGTKIYDKGSLESNLAYIGVCGIKDYQLFWSELAKVVDENPSDQSLSDCHALTRMGVKFDVRSFPSWLDIGNASSLLETRSRIKDKFDLLDKEDESIFLFDDFVIKFFANSDICYNRVKRAEDLRGLTPQILDFTDNFYKYKYASGDELSKVVNPSIVKKLIDWANVKLWVPISINPDKFKDIAREFYFQKTLNRISQFERENLFAKNERFIINGTECFHPREILERIKFTLGSISHCVKYHGDFVLDNILFNGEDFTLLDWRQDFGGKISFGDLYYDLSKLNHSLIVRHSAIYEDKFSFKIHDNVINCDIEASFNLMNSIETLKEECKRYGFDYQYVELLTAIIWINMAPLHSARLGELLFSIGTLHLNKCVQNYL
jgi:choline kinase